MLIIDGSYLEGGGQIIRTSTALSAITAKPVKIINIRAGREPSGLKTQHLYALRGIAKLCNAKIVEFNSSSSSRIFASPYHSQGWNAREMESSSGIFSSCVLRFHE